MEVEEATVEICRERAEAFRVRAAAEPDKARKGLYVTLAESWDAMAESLEKRT